VEYYQKIERAKRKILSSRGDGLSLIVKALSNYRPWSWNADEQAPHFLANFFTSCRQQSTAAFTHHRNTKKP